MGDNTIPNINASGLNAINTASMDIETALLAVQGKRAELMETQLRDQIAGVQAKNEQISKLNNVLSNLTGILANYATDANGSYTAPSSATGVTGASLHKEITAAGLTDLGWGGTNPANWNKDLKRNDIDAAVTKVKGQIDSLANSQQMDTLRLQSLSAKRNEAFEQMTNWIKKMQDVRNNILGNMR